MGNKYIYPTEKLNIQLNLEVDVKFVGVWSGMGDEFLQNKYQEMLEDGSFINLIKKTILSDLTTETFDWSNVEPFDRLCFKVTENTLGESYDTFK